MITRKILLAAMFIGFGAVPFARADSNDVAQIRTLETKLAAAAEARNLDAIMKAYIPDKTLFVFDVIPPRGRGKLTARTRNGYYAPGGANSGN